MHNMHKFVHRFLEAKGFSKVMFLSLRFLKFIKIIFTSLKEKLWLLNNVLKGNLEF